MQQRVVKGWNTSGTARGEEPNRLVRIKRYDGGDEIHVSIGPQNKKVARAAIALEEEQLEQLIEALCEAQDWLGSGN